MLSTRAMAAELDSLAYTASRNRTYERALPGDPYGTGHVFFPVTGANPKHSDRLELPPLLSRIEMQSDSVTPSNEHDVLMCLIRLRKQPMHPVSETTSKKSCCESTQSIKAGSNVLVKDGRQKKKTEKGFMCIAGQLERGV
jgi:hypothetical protein